MRTPSYVLFEKPIGQTPLEAIEAWKEAHPEFRNLPATYAGRLDPMASGKLLVLLGEECKQREKYLGLDKEYEIQVVLGARTDTGDALGIAELASACEKPAQLAVQAALQKLTGTHTVPYPAFSSKTVAGKPLFQYALEGTLNGIEIPKHEETLYRIQLINMQSLSTAALHLQLNRILTQVPKSDNPRKTLGADFRQGAIRERWSVLLEKGESKEFSVLTMRVICASGTYMRTLAERLGNELGTNAFALSIHRKKIGRYLPLGPFGFWWKQY